jgi:hypothetical protein
MNGRTQLALALLLAAGATMRLREAVERGAADGGAIVIPFLIGSGMVQRSSESRLEGFEYAVCGDGLIESDAMLEWLTLKVARALDTRLASGAT